MAKRVTRIIRKVDFEKQYVEGLKLELDYMLATLHGAMQNEDESLKEKCIDRLYELVQELEAFGAFN